MKNADRDLQQAIAPDRLVYYLSRSELLISYLREVIIEETLARWEQSPTAQKLLLTDEPVSTPIAPPPLELISDITPAQRRATLLQWYKEAEWGHLVISRFLASKDDLDRVLFSEIQVSDFHLAQELHCQICEQGHSFGKLAQAHSQSPTAQWGGAMGPILVAKLNLWLQYYLPRLEAKQLSPIFKLDRFYMFVRLDRWLPAQFTPQMRQQLLDRFFEEWLQQEIADRIGNIDATTYSPAPELPADPEPYAESHSSSPLDFSNCFAPTSSLFFPKEIPTDRHAEKTEDLITPSSLFFPQLPSTPIGPDRYSRWHEKIITYLTVKLRILFQRDRESKFM